MQIYARQSSFGKLYNVSPTPLVQYLDLCILDARLLTLHVVFIDTRYR